MSVEFQVPSLRVETIERLPEVESEQRWLEQLPELGEARIMSLGKLEQD